MLVKIIFHRFNLYMILHMELFTTLVGYTNNFFVRFFYLFIFLTFSVQGVLLVLTLHAFIKQTLHILLSLAAH